ncbi:5-oxoprolinase subunit PxpB [Paenibacillus sp. LMG 31456]|uniref:5-oxoprolinase subunit PxpB n=2 Tax=Paenibacillus foliorum TaxID=2654974 RepID=A0A972GSB0_9BACL|nr:5-oxoprolinase subunit PxpB [Paenibacillus foliorum]
MSYELYPLGEQAVVIRWGDRISEQTQRHIDRSLKSLERHWFPELTELVAAYRTVTVYYDPVALYLKSTRGYDPNEINLPYELICSWIHSCLREQRPEDVIEDSQDGKAAESANVKVVPVCFGGAYGPDLGEVALHSGLSSEEVVELYCSVSYFVHMVGFVPGFPYLGGLPERLQIPRRSFPREEVPIGSIGIAGGQTGIYPLASPGGWQLIGRTPVTLFDAALSQPALFKAGDYVRFEQISEAEFTVVSSKAKAEAGLKRKMEGLCGDN